MWELPQLDRLRAFGWNSGMVHYRFPALRCVGPSSEFDEDQRIHQGYPIADWHGITGSFTSAVHCVEKEANES
jgi:hypothetical protein